MTYDKKIDRSLKEMNKDIHWQENRQHYIRNKLINDLQQDKVTRIPTLRRKIVPAFSIILTLVILTLIVLGEFGASHLSTQDDTLNGIAHNNGNDQTQIITNAADDDNKDNTENDSSQDEMLDEGDAPDRLLTQPEIMAAIKGQMTSELTLKLPKQISLQAGKHLTAITSSSKDNYDVIFYQHDEPIPINNHRLFSADHPAEVIARLRVKKYETQEQADEAVSYAIFDESVGEPIKIREALTGFQDTSAESISINWNVGRWALTTYARSNESSVLLAQEVMMYLEQYMLPIPRQNGSIHLDAGYRESQITWQKGTTVYKIDQIKDPLKALEIAVNFE